jgi:hypothetical protein
VLRLRRGIRKLYGGGSVGSSSSGAGGRLQGLELVIRGNHSDFGPFPARLPAPLHSFAFENEDGRLTSSCRPPPDYFPVGRRSRWSTLRRAAQVVLADGAKEEIRVRSGRDDNSFMQLTCILCQVAETAASGGEVWQHYLVASHRDSKLSIAP